MAKPARHLDHGPGSGPPRSPVQARGAPDSDRRFGLPCVLRLDRCFRKIASVSEHGTAQRDAPEREQRNRSKEKMFGYRAAPERRVPLSRIRRLSFDGQSTPTGRAN